jgi:hypothetical protein
LSQPEQWVTVCIRYDRTHPEKRLIGYARVSTYGQTLDAQLEALAEPGGICISRVVRDQVRG